MDLSIKTIHFGEHNGELKDKIEGQRVLIFIDDKGKERGELVWRLASGHTVEITEFFIHDEKDQRQGWGTRLLNEALVDMREFLQDNSDYPGPLRRVWVLTERSNMVGRSFYEKSGFLQETVLEDFYDDGDAVLYIMKVE